MLRETIETYNQKAEYYKIRTDDIEKYHDLKRDLIRFTEYLSSLNKIPSVLDVGFGGGRDIRYFAQKGFEVEGLEKSTSFIGLIDTNKYRIHEGDMRFFQHPDKKRFDGIWCCSVVLHIAVDQLDLVLKNFKNLLVKGGIVFFSYKAGENSEFVHDQASNTDKLGRFFQYYTLESFSNYLIKNNYTVLEISRNDHISGTGNDWINLIARNNGE